MEGFPIECLEKVRYGDLDPYGHLNNTVFFQFFEQARLAYMTRLGLYGPGGRGTHNVTLAETSCRFLAEGRYDDSLTCGARVVRLGNRSLEMEHRLERGGQPVAEGKAALVWFDFEKRVSAPLPEELRQKIRELERSVGRSL